MMESKMFESCNILSVSVNTNCPQGGDAGHGGVTIFELEDFASTSWKLKYKIPGEEKEVDLEAGTLRIELYGDTECETFIQALEFALKELKHKERNNDADFRAAKRGES